MDQPIPPLQFSGEHVIQFAIRVDDSKGGLLIGPKPPEIRNFWKLMGWMLFVLSIALVFSLVMALNSHGPLAREAKAVPLLILLLGVPISYVLVGMLWFAACTEFEKGPVFVLDRTRRVVDLPRHKIEVHLDDLIAVALLSGQYYGPGSDGEHKAELSLIVVQADRLPLNLAFLMRSQSQQVEALAEQVAATLGRPLRRERIGMGGRVRFVVGGSSRAGRR